MAAAEHKPIQDSECVRVCLVTRSYHPVYSGPAIRFRNYIPQLRACGIEMEVFSGTPTVERTIASDVGESWAQIPLGELLPVTRLDGTPVHRVRLHVRGNLRSLRSQILFIRRFLMFCRKNRPQVVNFLSLPWPVTPWLGGLRRQGVRTVYTHTLLGELSSTPVRRWIQRRYWRWPFQRLDCIVVSSSLMKEALENLGVRSPIRVIPNGVDLSRYRPVGSHEEKQAARRASGLAVDGTVVLTVAPVVPRKGIDFLIQVWCRLAGAFPKALLVIAGPRYDLTRPSLQDFRQKIEQITASNGVDQRIQFVGAVDNVDTCMRASDLFVFASRREGMPNVFLEAMASGLPVVTTPFVGLPREFGIPGSHYLLAQRDVDQMANTIRELLNDPGRRQALGRSARQWVEKEMSLESAARQYADLYRELVS